MVGHSIISTVHLHTLIAPRLSITCGKALFALTQSTSIPEIDQFCLWQSNYLQLPVALRSDQKVQRNSVLTDQFLIANSNRKHKNANHVTYKAHNVYSRDST